MFWLYQFVMAIVSTAWLGQAVPADASTVAVHRTLEPRPPLVVVRALGLVPQEDLRRVCRVLLADHPVRCVIRARRELPLVLDAWDRERGQLDARRALDQLFHTRSEDAVVELDVTALDLYEPGKDYVFGLASLPDRTALLSTARLSERAGPHEPEVEPERAARRLETLARHELGHALGLVHHDVHDCVMRQDPTVASLDEAPDGPCLACQGKIDRQLPRLGRPGQTALDRARGLLVRDRKIEARRVLVDALWTYHPDPELLDDFARVFFEAGQYNEAISLLRHAVGRDPQRATAHVQLGLAYQRRGRDGDLALAVGHFERAVVLRPDWDSVADHLEASRAELRAQGP